MKGRKFLTAGSIMVLVMSMLAGAAGSALAVHDDGFFELDRNATSSSAPGEDWDVVYAGTDTATASSFTADGVGPTIFTGGGSKDDLDTTGWQHKTGSTPPKDELLDGFAARYGDIIYFGADRYSNSGDAVMGFWFFQQEVVALPDGTFGPDQHENGDILILSDFTGGGGNVTIRVFQWHSPGGSINGTLDLIAGSLLTPADCVGPPSVPAGDPFCATVNTANTPSPWPFQSKSGAANVFPPGHFYEGGIDLTFLGLEDECFSSFLAETRSSTSVNATLKDFVGGSFAPCETSMTTDASSNEFTLGGSVTDTATLTASGTPTAPTGNVDFYVCGPSAGISSCDATGTFLSSEDLAGATGTPPQYSVTSDSFTPVEAGDYCFFATYAGAGAYPPASVTDFTDECFTVNPLQPAISTNATADPVPVSLGTAIDDVATLGGTALDPDGTAADGTITFTAYGPFAATGICTGTAVYTSVVNVSGDGDYTASTGTGGTFTPTQAGTYNWIAVYSGDSPNTLGVSGACGDANEGSVIISLQPTISTAQRFVPNDSATIAVAAGAGNLTGSVRFRLYDNATCSGTSTLIDQTVTVTGASPQTVSTTNTTAITTTKTTLSWLVEYTSTNAGHRNVTSTCATENSSLTINNG